VAAQGPQQIVRNAEADQAIRQLATPDGKVRYLGSINPGGPSFGLSAPMRQLVKFGTVIQPRLLSKLKDPRIHNEVAIILAYIGDRDALPRLIECLPTEPAANLSEEENLSTLCVLYALWHLTGLELGISHKFSPEYTPDFRKQWQTWYDTNKDYLYRASKSQPAANTWGRGRVQVDVGAKLANRPTTAYREQHPWITYEEIKTWRDDPAYQQKLKDFCFALILNLSWHHFAFVASADAIDALGRIHDPRALAALHRLCALAEDADDCFGLIEALAERGDPSSIQVLERIPPSKPGSEWAVLIERKRKRALERIRLLQKYHKELEGKPFNSDQQILFMQCLDDPKGMDEFLADLRAPRDNSSLAAYLDRPPVRRCLTEMAQDAARTDRVRTMVHGTLAQLGEKDSLAYLRRALRHKEPWVRFAAAEGLWHLGNREGFQTLVDLLSLRPIESGGEGVEVGNGSLITVKAIPHPNVDLIRSACDLLGEMGNRAAIEPLKGLLRCNLNGILATNGSGSGWPGRPDAVALAKLGDFSGIALLRDSIRSGDPLDVVSSRGGAGDFVAIGLKRFIPELLPLLENPNERKSMPAAQGILLLLESGR
jgi:HEAT repeat protein